MGRVGGRNNGKLGLKKNGHVPPPMRVHLGHRSGRERDKNSPQPKSPFACFDQQHTHTLVFFYPALLGVAPPEVPLSSTKMHFGALFFSSLPGMCFVMLQLILVLPMIVTLKWVRRAVGLGEVVTDSDERMSPCTYTPPSSPGIPVSQSHGGGEVGFWSWVAAPTGARRAL